MVEQVVHSSQLFELAAHETTPLDVLPDALVLVPGPPVVVPDPPAPPLPFVVCNSRHAACATAARMTGIISPLRKLITPSPFLPRSTPAHPKPMIPDDQPFQQGSSRVSFDAP